MPVISEAITSRNYEIVRDRIGEILKDELPNQATLNDLSYLNASVWRERDVPFSYTEIPAVNVLLNSQALNSYTQYTEDWIVKFDIEVYMSSKTIGTNRGDEKSSVEMQRLAGVVCAILMHNRYKTLGFEPNGFIMNRHVSDVKIGVPKESNDATSMTMALISFEVRVADGTETPDPILLEDYQTQVQLGETESGYLWGITN